MDGMNLHEVPATLGEARLMRPPLAPSWTVYRLRQALEIGRADELERVLRAAKRVLRAAEFDALVEAVRYER